MFMNNLRDSVCSQCGAPLVGRTIPSTIETLAVGKSGEAPPTLDSKPLPSQGGEPESAGPPVGTGLPAPTGGTMMIGSLITPRHCIVQQFADGSTGTEIEIPDHPLTIGREGCDLTFETDEYLSKVHARVEARGQDAHVEDCGSSNGTFLKLRGPRGLTPGDQILLGNRLLHFLVEAGKTTEEERPEPQKDPKSTMLFGALAMGSPRPRFTLVEIQEGGIEGDRHPLRAEEIRLGRVSGDLTFPDDEFMSGAHARLIRSDDGYRIEDLGSTNGTYIRIRERTRLSDGDRIRLGSQVFSYHRKEGRRS